MNDFNQAVLTVLKHEGGYVNDPKDAGGATNFGISLRFFKTINPTATIEDIKKLTREAAIEIYKKYWWDKYHYGELGSQTIATKVFDLSVNMGPKQAHKLLQLALMDCGSILLTLDGILGPRTMKACTDADQTDLLQALREQAANYYRSLNQPRFLKGWLRRAYA